MSRMVWIQSFILSILNILDILIPTNNRVFSAGGWVIALAISSLAFGSCIQRSVSGMVA